jgi:DNA topoisomerase-1
VGIPSAVPRLRRVDCAEPGYRRQRRGRGFAYLGKSGARLRDPAQLERIRSLAIPPAWTDVWICPYANGHLQAVGTDAAGRRQYLYHPAWRANRDREKFDEMLAFAQALPKVRRRSTKLVAGDGLTKERVLAGAVLLLDRGLFRIGSEEYAEENGSYGLATLERRHVKLEARGTIVFDYVGKTGKHLTAKVVDRRLHAVAAELKQRRHRRSSFLGFENGRGWTEVRPAEINAFIKELADGDFSAKDFRTWHATVIAAASLALSDESPTTAGRRRAINEATAEVAEALGNTPAVCKSSYIDPRVFDLYRSGDTIASSVARPAPGELRGNGTRQRRARERAVLRLLSED